MNGPVSTARTVSVNIQELSSYTLAATCTRSIDTTWEGQDMRLGNSISITYYVVVAEWEGAPATSLYPWGKRESPSKIQ